jgi:hypothetical protein
VKYDFQAFDLYAKLSEELDDFKRTKIKVGGSAEDQVKGYEFSQADTVNLVEYVVGSRFSDSELDSTGQRKVYLNSSVFRADVASKQIDIDVKDIALIPDDSASDYGCVVARKMLKRWAKDTGLGEQLNEMVERFPTYGTVVLKKRGKEYDLVPIQKLRNQQDADSLDKASYVIIEHKLKYWEAAAMPDWDLSGLECAWDEDIVVMERYGRVPVAFLGRDGEEHDSVDTVSFIARSKKGRKVDSALLFIEEITERPFEEVHWKRRQGRWLGVGEIEQNFENQKARNYIFNLRLRSAMWASKQIYQSTDDSLAKNLVSEVRDGDVMRIEPNGQITKVNVGSQALADYNAIDQSVEDNANQKSFTFEVATGESLPSGTPFRLGVMMSQAVNSHFALKREKLALFIKRWLYAAVLPAFEKDLDAESLEYFAVGQEGYEDLVNAVADARVAAFVKDSAIKRGRIPSQAEQAQYREQIMALKGFEIKVLKDAVKNLKYSVDIVITGESVDLAKKVETLTSLHQTLLAAGDIAAANKVLGRIITLTGERMPATSDKSVAMMPSVASTMAMTPANAPNATATV